jgi:hypothetical protein
MTNGTEHQVTQEMRDAIMRLSTNGLTQEQAALVVGISPETLRKYYSKDWDFALANGIAIVAGGVFLRAVNGIGSDPHFYLERRGGKNWQRTDKLTHSGVVEHKAAPEIIDALKMLTKDVHRPRKETKE